MKLIKFAAPWCGPCKVYKKTFDKVAEEYKDKLEVEEYNVEDHEDLVEKYGVRNVPTTLIVSDDEKVLANKIGLLGESDLKKMIDECLK